MPIDLSREQQEEESPTEVIAEEDHAIDCSTEHRDKPEDPEPDTVAVEASPPPSGSKELEDASESAADPPAQQSDEVTEDCLQIASSLAAVPITAEAPEPTMDASDPARDPEAGNGTEMVDAPSTTEEHPDDRRVSFAPGTPEPKPTARKKKGTKGKKKRVAVPMDSLPPDVMAMLDGAFDDLPPPPPPPPPAPPAVDECLVAPDEATADSPSDEVSPLEDTAKLNSPAAAALDESTQQDTNLDEAPFESEKPLDGFQDGPTEEAAPELSLPPVDANDSAPLETPEADAESDHPAALPAAPPPPENLSVEEIPSRKKSSKSGKDKDRSKKKSKTKSIEAAGLGIDFLPPVPNLEDIFDHLPPPPPPPPEFDIGEAVQGEYVDVTTHEGAIDALDQPACAGDVSLAADPESENSEDSKPNVPETPSAEAPSAPEVDDEVSPSTEPDKPSKADESPESTTLVAAASPADSGVGLEEMEQDPFSTEDAKLDGVQDTLDEKDSGEQSGSAVDVPEADEKAVEVADEVAEEALADTPAEEQLAEEPADELPPVEDAPALEPEPEEHATEEPVADAPAAEEPVADAPAAEEPAADAPAAEEPAANGAAVENTIAKDLVGDIAADTEATNTDSDDAHGEDGAPAAESGSGPNEEDQLPPPSEDAPAETTTLDTGASEGCADEASAEPDLEVVPQSEEPTGPNLDVPGTVEEVVPPEALEVPAAEEQAAHETPTGSLEDPEAVAPPSPNLSKGSSHESHRRKADHWERKHADNALKEVLEDTKVLLRSHASKGKEGVRIADQPRRSRRLSFAAEEDEERRRRRALRKAAATARLVEEERRLIEEEERRRIRHEARKAARKAAAEETARIAREEAEAAARREAEIRRRKHRSRDEDRDSHSARPRREAKAVLPVTSVPGLPKALSLAKGESVHKTPLIRTHGGAYRPASDQPLSPETTRHKRDTLSKEVLNGRPKGEGVEGPAPSSSGSKTHRRHRHHNSNSERPSRSSRDSDRERGSKQPVVDERPRGFFGALMRSF